MVRYLLHGVVGPLSSAVLQRFSSLKKVAHFPVWQIFTPSRCRRVTHSSPPALSSSFRYFIYPTHLAIFHFTRSSLYLRSQRHQFSILIGPHFKCRFSVASRFLVSIQAGTVKSPPFVSTSAVLVNVFTFSSPIKFNLGLNFLLTSDFKYRSLEC